MFYLTGIEQLTKAIARCKAYHPHVKIVEFGLYAVTGESGSRYVVSCHRDEQGRKVIDCQCKGAQRGFICKHAPAAIAQHIHLAEAKRLATA